jgi:hypothetical protein
MLNSDDTIFLYNKILNAIEPALTATEVVAKADNVPPGTQQVKRVELQKLQGNATRNKPGEPINRELATLTRTFTYIVEHAHGFDIHDQDLKAAQNPQSMETLPSASARQSARVVAELVNDMILNGIPYLDTPILGIYANAANTYTVASGSEWDRSGVTSINPFNDILNAVEVLTQTSQYRADFLMLGPKAWVGLNKTNSLGISYMQMLDDSGLFPNGRDSVILAPKPANKNASPIIPATAGVLGMIDNDIAERYVQTMPTGVPVDDVLEPQTDITGHSSMTEGDIALMEYPIDKNNMWPFNVQTYQGFSLHYPDAFVALQNLTTS